jgi:8-oxo-dGTP diphosphatase
MNNEQQNILKNQPAHIKFAVLASDIVPLTYRHGEICVRLIKVNRPPHFNGVPGLPGGLLDPKETADEAAYRHLRVRTGIDPNSAYIEQLYTFSAVDRDPRGRVVSVAYLALMPWDDLSPAAQADTAEAWWCPLEKVPKLAYDHDEVMKMAVERLRAKVAYTTLAMKLLPSEFVLSELETCYEKVLGRRVDKRNFRKKIIKLGLLKQVGEMKKGNKWRPAQLYRFADKSVKNLEIL